MGRWMAVVVDVVGVGKVEFTEVGVEFWRGSGGGGTAAIGIFLAAFRAEGQVNEEVGECACEVDLFELDLAIAGILVCEIALEGAGG